MDNRYRLILSNNNFYREVQLPSNAAQYRIGTTYECDCRFAKERFFTEFELIFINDGRNWSVNCKRGDIYFQDKGSMKLKSYKLEHGAEIHVLYPYQGSDLLLFNLSLILDFEAETANYDRVLEIGALQIITFGRERNCDVILDDSLLGSDIVKLERRGRKLFLIDLGTRYGVYVNGIRIQGEEQIRDYDFFSILEFSFYYKDGELFTSKFTKLFTTGIRTREVANQKNHLTYPQFNRNTQVKINVPAEDISVLDPPAKPEKPKQNIVMTLLPSLAMIALVIVMRGMMGGGNISFVLYSAASMGLGVVTTIIGFISGKKEYKESVTKREEAYTAYIQKKREEIELARKKERELLEEIYISPEQEEENVQNFTGALFDRTPEDEEFLTVRIGTGSREAARKVSYKAKEEIAVSDPLAEQPQQLYTEFCTIDNVPVTLPLSDANAAGVVGNESALYEFAKQTIIDICTRQYYDDVKLFFITESSLEPFAWARWLPHFSDQSHGIRNFAASAEERTALLEYLYSELLQRSQQKRKAPHFVVLVYCCTSLKNHPISRFINNASELGVSFLFFENYREFIPQYCSRIVTLHDSVGSGTLILASDSEKECPFSYRSISDESAAKIALKLAPVYCEEISLEGTLTKSISFFEMMGIFTVDDLDLNRNWSSAQIYKTMAAPIGVKTQNELVYLDLHEKAHGPHGLVAGTTGSGKSEVLQTYILSMAITYHPYEVGFVIIDFKGGGMANQFEKLPHLVGTITNIDGREIDRSLKSIKAELQKRQRVFAEAGVNNIGNYIRKYKAGEVTLPLPHLIIIVDEFAELKAEQPEFMKELISAARIGRSLGVHLILATQKPSGQVNEQIWSNSRFKLCLKVQDAQDSNEVLKSPLAAEIKEPGRAYLQVGNNEIFELFQSAYSGASEKVDDSKVKEFAIYSLTGSGGRVPVYVQKKPQSSKESSTQLDAIVQYISSYCEKQHVQKLPDICLPALGNRIAFPEAVQLNRTSSNIIAEIGVYDDPDNQYQGQYAVDLTNQNVMIIGSSQSGKTNVLQNIIRSISTKYTPKEVNIYIIDFASMVLKTYEKLNHVGGVVTSSEDEKLKNLIKLLKTEIEARKERLLSVGVSSFAAYKEAGRNDLPQIVLLIDNLTALKELYFQDDDELLNLCREGLSVGISIVIANAQTAGIGYKYLSNFSCRIAMFCNDSGEYGALFDYCSERIEDIHGRCIIEIDKVHLDCQAYLAFEGEKEIDRVEAIKEYIANTNAKNEKMFANIIPVIPNILTLDFMLNTFTSYMQEKHSIAVGLNYDSVRPYVLDLSALGVLAISGRERSGKNNIVKYITCLLDQVHPETSEVYIIDGVERRLAALKGKSNVVSYDILPDKGIAHIKSIEQELQRRYSVLAGGNETILENSKLILLILNSSDTVEAISNDPAALTAYKNITGKYKNMNVCILLSGFENANVPYSAPEIIKKARDAKHFLFFDDLANMKIFDLPLAVMRNYKKPIETGDCYYIRDNEYVKLKTARVSQSDVN